MLHRRVLLGAVLAIVSSFASPAYAQQITETFSGNLSLGNGTIFGQCNQLVSRRANGGSIAVSGGLATLTTSTVAAGAIIASAAPLPGSFHLRSNVRGLQVDGATPNNYMQLLVVVNKAPSITTASYYNNATTVEVVAYPGFGIVVAVYDSGGVVRSWNGSTWVQSYVAALANYASSDQWVVVIDRTSGGVKVTITRNGASAVDTTRLSNANVRGGPYYLGVGEATTDLGASSIQIDEIEMPQPVTCPPPPDASVDSTRDSGPSSDTTRDTGSTTGDSTVDRGSTTTDGPVTTKDKGIPTSDGQPPLTDNPQTFDLPTQPTDSGPSTGRFDVAFNPNPPSANDSSGCAFGPGDAAVSTLALVLLALLALAATRRRRRD